MDLECFPDVMDEEDVEDDLGIVRNRVRNQFSSGEASDLVVFNLEHGSSGQQKDHRSQVHSRFLPLWTTFPGPGALVCLFTLRGFSERRKSGFFSEKSFLEITRSGLQRGGNRRRVTAIHSEPVCSPTAANEAGQQFGFVKRTSLFFCLNRPLRLKSPYIKMDNIVSPSADSS